MAGLRWTEGDLTHQGFRGFWPKTKPPDGEGWFVADVVRYSGDTWRVYFRRFNVDDQPIKCWFPDGASAMAQADAWFDAHPDMRPGRRQARERDWY